MTNTPSLTELAPGFDLLTMSDAQCLVLNFMDDEYSYPFSYLSEETSIPERECRRIVRTFHAMGLTRYGPLFDTDDGHVCGRGYWLSDAGYRASQHMRLLADRWFLDRDAAAFESLKSLAMKEQDDG